MSITSKAVFVLGQTSLGCDTVTSQQEKTQHQTFGPCNSFYCLGHYKNDYDDDGDDDDDDERCCLGADLREPSEPRV